ncbi:MAG: TetR/AcrR family transcriptional regulator [Acidobacteria bacterium]|nr:TetR/AcrR family transcriptional regulator [Acidobacteriota bacterium]
MTTDRQMEIINKSMEIIAEGGIQALSTKNLALSMGFTEAAIYRHFKSKLEILDTLLDVLLHDIDDELKTTEESNLSPRQKFTRFFEIRTESFINNPSQAAVIFADDIFINEEVLIDKLREIMDHVRDHLVLWAEKAQTAGEFRTDIPLKHIAHIYMSSYRVLIGRWKMDGYKEDLKTQVNKLFKTLDIIFS